LEEAQRYREAQAKWNVDFASATNRFSDLSKEIRKNHETAARHAKIDALTVSDAEKALLKNDPDAKEAKELAKKFSKELKVEDKDFRQCRSEDVRSDWDEREKVLKAVEARKPTSLPTAYAFADFGAKPRETFLLARGDFHKKSEPVELGFLTALTRG